MAYRMLEEPPKPENLLRKFDVRNGAVMRTTFGCYYTTNGHDPHYHDFVNWPAPNYHPGPICQMHPPRTPWRWLPHPITRNPIILDPIHLIEEGYQTQAIVEYEDAELAEHMHTSAWIDEDDDNLVRMVVHADFPVFHDKPIENRFTLFIKKEDNSIIDAVCHGIVTVLPGSPVPNIDCPYD